jgi:hypothetical protein
MIKARTKPKIDPKVRIPPAAKSVAACTLRCYPRCARVNRGGPSKFAFWGVRESLWRRHTGGTSWVSGRASF